MKALGLLYGMGIKGADKSDSNSRGGGVEIPPSSFKMMGNSCVLTTVSEGKGDRPPR